MFSDKANNIVVKIKADATQKTLGADGLRKPFICYEFIKGIAIIFFFKINAFIVNMP